MNYLYEINQKVFAEYQGHLYEATCLKRKVTEKGVFYFLKYTGFGKRNNKWQNQDDILPYTEENQELMLTRRAAAAEAKEREKQTKKRVRTSSEHVAKKSKETDQSEASESDPATSPQTPLEKFVVHQSLLPPPPPPPIVKQSGLTVSATIKSSLSVPLTLSRNLVYQHLCHQQRMLVPLPRRPNVHDILEQFVRFEAEDKDTSRKQAEKSFCRNLEILFCVTLGQRLLWSVERPQYANRYAEQQALPEEQQLTYFATIYGGEHLLRLIVLLPELLRICIHPNAQLITKDDARLLAEFIHFFNEHREEFLTPTYDLAPPEYLRLCQFAGL
eukprot:m.255302 g.255302  ORF g.255302 m.255302 type:complete len:330 (+) comp19338_c0_seq1:213-1202(+)